jgi:hypothetical protein
MKQQLGSFFKLITGFIVVLTLGACLLPAKVSSTYSVTLSSRMEDIFPLISDLGEWSTWMEPSFLNTDTSRYQAVWKMPAKSPGVSFFWGGSNHAQKHAILRVRELKEPNQVSYVVSNDDHELVHGHITLQQEAAGTLLTWTISSTIGNPWGRYMSFFIKGWMLREIKENIRNLHRYLLQLGKVDGVVTEVIFRPDGGDTVLALFEMDTIFRDNFSDLRQYILNVKAEKFRQECERYPLEMIYSPYYSKAGKLEDGRQIVQIGFPVKDTFGYKGHYRVNQHSGPVIFTKYIGPEDNQYRAIEALEAYARINGLSLKGAPLYTLTDQPIADGMYKGIIPLVVSIQVVP